MSILRIIVILADVIILGWLIWSASTEVSPRGNEWFLFFGVLLVMALNIFFITVGKRDDNWITLFFKRKALEEKKRMADLEADLENKKKMT
ncbi:MAG: hypothetical protein AB1465_03800 [Patescibacteria group bacterium]